MPSSYHGFVPMPLTPPYTDGSYPPPTMQYPSANVGQCGMSRQQEHYDPALDANNQYLSRYSLANYPGNDFRPAPPFGVSMGNAKVPTLPPIQTQGQSVAGYTEPQQSQRNKPVAAPKEEKPVGGVAAHLDYEMELMVDFVSASAQEMYDLYQSRICLADIDIIRSVNPSAAVPSAFRKYVSQVLTSTRLPSSTIFYGLYYLAHRMTELSKAGVFPKGTGQVYRMLTTALLLGSKFLDDNTFQNRSWSEVSNIPVAELNILELEWLKSIGWDLHIDLDDPNAFLLWEAQWKSYQAKQIELSMASLKLSPLNANIQRQPSSNKRVSPTLPYPSAYYNSAFGVNVNERLPSQWQASQYGSGYGTWAARAQYSPPSAPHTGPNTPDWYGGGWGNYRSYGSSEATTPASAQTFQSFAQQASYQKAYTPQYTQGNVPGHNVQCGCGYCVTTVHDPFYATQYRSQAVAG